MAWKRNKPFSLMNDYEVQEYIKQMVADWGWDKLTEEEEKGLCSAMLASVRHFYPHLTKDSDKVETIASLTSFL